MPAAKGAAASAGDQGRTAVSTTWVGQSVPRKEDPRLLAGSARFIADWEPMPNLRHAAILRSPYAHARIRALDASAALRMPGVVGVVTGAEVARLTRPFSNAAPTAPPYYCAAVDKVRFVGEPVAVVVATDRYRAEDALEAITVEYEPLPAVVDPELAARPNAPLLHEAQGTNVAVHRHLRYGDPEAAFARARHTIERRFVFPKFGSTPIETYGVIAAYDAAEEVVTVWSNFQGPFSMHPVVAQALNLPEDRLRFVVPPDIGGGFGIKTSIYPYITLIALAAMVLRVPVKWIEDRREHLMASSSGTDRVYYVAAAYDDQGVIDAMRMRIYDSVGGYLRPPEPGCLFRPLGNYVGGYRFRHLEVDAYGVVTNKMPTGPNRGYGVGHLYFGIERLVDEIAHELALDPAEVRLRNLIPPEAMPYTTPTGGIYDAGDYPAALRKVLAMADYPALRERQRQARAEGKWMGIGIAVGVDPSVSNMGYVNIALTPEQRAKQLPKSGGTQATTIQMGPLGSVVVQISTTPQGQGHETVVAQIVADELSVRPQDVRVVSGIDTFTSAWTIPSGTYSSRFASVGASSAALAARKLKAKILKIAAHLLECSVDDLVMAEGKIWVQGVPERSVSLRRVAGTAHWDPHSLPPGMEPGLTETAYYTMATAKPADEMDRVNSSATYSFMADVVVVTIDRDTLRPTIEKYWTVHDAGTILNPRLAEGQVWGAALHGIGGALYEEMAYDNNGQLLTATFMDYLVPTAMEAPRHLEIGHVVVPSPFTLLGSKGIGESNTETVPAAVANAITDALRPLGIAIDALPVTPSRLWEALHRRGLDAIAFGGGPAREEAHR
jgi:2-furoyl-CoA dehydrogenase large subunit